VRRVVCEGCHQPFACETVLDVGVVEPAAARQVRRRGERRPATPARRRPPRQPRAARTKLTTTSVRGWLSNPESHIWRYLSIPIAAAAVIVALVLIQGSGEPARHSASSAAPAAPGPSSGEVQGAKVIKGSSFTLAMPPGWNRSEPGNGATFAATSSDGTADATLWISRDPNLSYPDFEARSLAQLHTLAGSAHVVSRVTAPTAEGTVVTLAADSPPDQPAYEVTLRVAGPYRYYLATTVDPSASREAVDGADLVHQSLVPTTASSS
jgi:hypothetical protein